MQAVRSNSRSITTLDAGLIGLLLCVRLHIQPCAKLYACCIRGRVISGTYMNCVMQVPSQVKLRKVQLQRLYLMQGLTSQMLRHQIWHKLHRMSSICGRSWYRNVSSTYFLQQDAVVARASGLMLLVASARLISSQSKPCGTLSCPCCASIQQRQKPHRRSSAGGAVTT